MDTATALIITLVSMAFSAFFSGMEIAFISSNKVRAGVDSQKKGLTSRIINTFYSRQDMFISTMLVGNNIMLVVYGIGIAVLLEPGIKSVVGDNEALILVCQTIISTGIILITGEFLPKTIFRINPNISLRHCAVGLYVIYLVLYPISWFSSWLSKSLMHLFGAKASAPRSALLTVSELDDYIQQTIDDKNAGKTGAEEIEHEVKIFQNALDFSNTLLRDCMIPRNEIVAVSSDTDRERLRRRFTATGLSKILVYTDDIDNIIGYIHVNELFNTATEWQKCIKPVDFAPESMPANTMMRKMLAEKRSIAVIVDEFGGTGGLVTLEDLVEEIFGEIEDEHDMKSHVAKKVSDNEYLLSGRMEIDTLNEMFGLDLPESDDYVTIAGFILHFYQKFPKLNETVQIDKYSFKIIKVTATKIELVRMKVGI